MLSLAEQDERVVAGAAVGSLAVGGGDRFSDLDLTFAVADDATIADVLGDWTRTLHDELAAVQLVDLERGATIYRVFLLPDALQFDLSLTPAARFAPAGARFRLLFGETAGGDAAVAPKPPDAADSSAGASSTACTRARASSAAAFGRRSTTSARSGTTLSRSPASAGDWRRYRHAVTTTYRLTPSPASRKRTWAPSSLSGSAALSRRPSERS
jgi:hypothetical protein